MLPAEQGISPGKWLWFCGWTLLWQVSLGVLHLVFQFISEGAELAMEKPSAALHYFLVQRSIRFVIWPFPKIPCAWELSSPNGHLAEIQEGMDSLGSAWPQNLISVWEVMPWMCLASLLCLPAPETHLQCC